jgi:hypothetical protein
MPPRSACRRRKSPSNTLVRYVAAQRRRLLSFYLLAAGRCASASTAGGGFNLLERAEGLRHRPAGRQRWATVSVGFRRTGAGRRRATRIAGARDHALEVIELMCHERRLPDSCRRRRWISSWLADRRRPIRVVQAGALAAGLAGLFVYGRSHCAPL